jgi:hypothetical protein
MGRGVSTGDLSLAALLFCASVGAVPLLSAPPQGWEPVLSRALSRGDLESRHSDSPE